MVRVIRSETHFGIPVGSLKPQDTFEYNGHCYIVVNDNSQFIKRAPIDQTMCFNLENGCAYLFYQDLQVIPIDIKCNIIKHEFDEVTYGLGITKD